MKKILASLLVLALSFLLSAPAQAAEASPAPTKQDILVMKHNLLTLWKMGIKSSQPMGEAELMASTLVFLLQGGLEESAEVIYQHILAHRRHSLLPLSALSDLPNISHISQAEHFSFRHRQNPQALQHL